MAEKGNKSAEIQRREMLSRHFLLASAGALLAFLVVWLMFPEHSLFLGFNRKSCAFLASAGLFVSAIMILIIFSYNRP